MHNDNMIENYHEKSVDEKRRIAYALCMSYDMDREDRCINCPYENQSDSWCRKSNVHGIPDELLDSVIESLLSGLRETRII